MTPAGSRALTEPLDNGIRRTLPAIADEWVDVIRRRTEAGKDADGRPFAPKKDGTPSNLRDTGRMLDGFGVSKIDVGGFTLGPSRREAAKAYTHQHGSAAVPQRAWVGVDDRTVAEARERIAEAALPRNRK